MDGRGKREREREREREGGREREELLRFAKEGRRKDLDGRRREQIRPPTSKRKHPLFGEKKRGGLFGGEFGQGFFFIIIFFRLHIAKFGATPPPQQKHFFRSVFFLAIFYYCQNGDHPQEDLTKFG
jgi:hypothetical protein